MNSHQRMIYSSQIKHGLEWKRHKYLYKDANGNYVYPEDVKNNAKSKVQGFVADQKQKLKDKKFVKSSDNDNMYGRARRVESQKLSAHHEGLVNLAMPDSRFPSSFDKRAYNKLEYSKKAERNSSEIERNKRREENDRLNNELINGTYSPAKNKARVDTIKRKEEKKFLEERKKINQQQKSAHAGAEAFKEKFPNGGSTEELERQKERTKTRKERKEAHGTNKQRAAGKAKLDKIHNRAKAAESARNTHTDSNHSLSLSRHSPSKDKWAKELDQINSAHQGSTRKYHDNEWDYTELENRGHLTSDSVERQKHKTRLRKLRRRRGK